VCAGQCGPEVRIASPHPPQNLLLKRLKKGLGTSHNLWYYFVAFDALVSPLEREESGRKVTLAAFFCVRPKTAKLC
jgi:hypothetical protein